MIKKPIYTVDSFLIVPISNCPGGDFGGPGGGFWGPGSLLGALGALLGGLGAVLGLVLGWS